MSELKLMLPEEEESLKMARAGVDDATILNVQKERKSFVKRIGNLSPEEEKQVDEFAKSINIHNPKVATKYALTSQGRLSELANKSLRGVAGKDIGDVGELLANMSIAMTTFNNDFDSELGRNKPRRFFGRTRQNIAESKERIRVKYDDVLKTLNRIAAALDDRYKELDADSEMLDKLYDNILQYFKELTMYILAAKKALNIVVRGELMELKKIADESNLPEDAQAFQKCQDDCNKFEKRIYDLELTRAICIQNMPQIRVIQMSDSDIMQQIVSTINNSIPLWKQGIATGLALAHSEKATNALRTMRNLTGEMLKKNAELLEAVGTEAARQSEEGYIDPAAIMESNKILIKTLGEIASIHQKGLEKRNNMRKCLAESEEELAATLKRPYTTNLEEWAIA